VFIKYEAKVSSRVSGGERGVVDFGKLFTETNEQKFSLGGVAFCTSSSFRLQHGHPSLVTSVLRASQPQL